jgi:hypothetical protein
VNHENWIALALGAALIILTAALVMIRVRRKPSFRRSMGAVAADAVRHVLVPDGMGGEIYVEHLLLTAHGLVVLDVKEYEGAIFGSDAMNEWTVIGERRRFTFPNPQNTLYDRVAALRQMAGDIPVVGYVLFPPGADFSKGRPKDVILPEELQAQYHKPERAELEQAVQRYEAQWQHIKRAVRPAGAGLSRRL